jgi:hypothetical protein
MKDAKDPVNGMLLANDPGERALSADEARQEAAAFHDSDAKQHLSVNYPSIVRETQSVNPATVSAEGASSQR